MDLIAEFHSDHQKVVSALLGLPNPGLGGFSTFWH